MLLGTAAAPHRQGTPWAAPRGANRPRPSLRGGARRQALRPQAAAAGGDAPATKDEGSSKRTAVVVGGGWAGFGAAHQLLKNGFDEVTLLDAADNPGGLSTGWRTEKGRAVEAGIKGFWATYANIFALADELALGDIFTPWCESNFYSAEGLEVKAPVLGDMPRLPAPLGTLVYTSPYFQRLSLADRLTALPLLRPMLEFDTSEEEYERLDQMSMEELCLGSGMSDALWKDFLEPILLVLMFAPGSELSAAAALSVLYGYVLAHQQDFDVRWCRRSVSEAVFLPWRRQMEGRGAAVKGGRFLRSVELAPDGRVGKLHVAVKGGGEEETYEPSAVVLAVGVRAFHGILDASPGLDAAPDLAGVRGMETTDVMAVRLWLDKRVKSRTASNVFAFGDGVGGTFYDLNELQDEYAEEEGSSVVEVDFYHAGALLGLKDEEVVERAHLHYLAGCEPAYRAARVADASVLRFGGAVTRFSPGSHSKMPPTRTSVPGLYMAGDWVRQGPGSHGARGLSQEKALVTGMIAANEAARAAGLHPACEPIPAEEDEPHIAAGKDVARQLRGLAAALGVEV